MLADNTLDMADQHPGEGEEEFPSGAEDIPPEVVFERNVFAGAERVRLYYEVTVQRDNQLKKMAGGIKKICGTKRRITQKNDKGIYNIIIILIIQRKSEIRAAKDESAIGAVGL